MAKPLVDDELWKLIQPLLPLPKPRRWRYPGRKRLRDRPALTGILFVLKSGIPWEMLPQEMGCGSGMRIEPVLAQRFTEHGSGLGIHRWVVERTLAWLHQFRRLRIRYERRADIHEAFLSLGCSLICLKRLKSF